jgi:hypothetical protein
MSKEIKKPEKRKPCYGIGESIPVPTHKVASTYNAGFNEGLSACEAYYEPIIEGLKNEISNLCKVPADKYGKYLGIKRYTNKDTTEFIVKVTAEVITLREEIERLKEGELSIQEYIEIISECPSFHFLRGYTTNSNINVEGMLEEFASAIHKAKEEKRK